jgi:hypothetical protein
VYEGDHGNTLVCEGRHESARLDTVGNNVKWSIDLCKAAGQPRDLYRVEDPVPEWAHDGASDVRERFLEWPFAQEDCNNVNLTAQRTRNVPAKDRSSRSGRFMNENEDSRPVRFDPGERECERVCDGKSPSPLRPARLKIVAEPVSAPSGDIRVAFAIVDRIESRGGFESSPFTHEDVVESWVESLSTCFRSRIVGACVEERAVADQSSEIGRVWIQARFGGRRAV